MKKDLLKCTLLLILGLIVTFLIYPFMHELGHCIATVLVGAKAQRLTLFPISSTLCNVSALDNFGIIAIGFGGMLFPILFAIVTPRRWFITWFVRCLLLGISVLASVISSVSIILDINQQDDMIQILNFWKHGDFLLIAILCVICIFTTILIVKDNPSKRIYKFFEI